MNRAGIAALTALLGALALGLCVQTAPEPVAPCPTPAPAPCPGPGPCPVPQPKPKPSPWGPRTRGPVGLDANLYSPLFPQDEDPYAPLIDAAGPSIVNDRSHDGEEVTADFPAEEWIKNIGSHADRAGMCVMSSIEMNALYLGLEQFRGLRDWCAQQPGGGWPDKVDEQIAAYCKAKGIKPVPYLQFTGVDPTPILAQLDRAGLPFCCTYGYSPRYGRQTIAHMVFGVKYGGRFGVIVDNNEIGGLTREHRFEWMGTDELLNRMRHPSGSAWVFAWVAPPPPAPPAPNL